MYVGDGPDPAEEFTVVRVSDTKIALKTGYGRYVSVNAAGELVGRTEAIGPRETWEPVFEDVSFQKPHVYIGVFRRMKSILKVNRHLTSL